MLSLQKLLGLFNPVSPWLHPHLIIILVSLIAMNYITATLHYQRAQKQRNIIKEQIPPRYPALVPFFGSLLLFMWDHGNFLSRAT